MMLALDVEFLLDVCFAAQGPSDPSPDWPPQPDRLFSALVATWATRGERAAERSALEWLERQAPPRMVFTDANARMAPSVFVPPNDASGSQLHALPGHRRRQERRFPATVPDHPSITYCWDGHGPNPDIFAALQCLARDTPYLGHSASVVRCYFRQQELPSAACSDAAPARTRVYPGRLMELEAAFRQKRRPTRGEIVAAQEPRRVSDSDTVFGSEWHVFADAGGHIPDLRRAAVASRAMRMAILSGFRGGPVPESISGHQADGHPSRDPHLAIFPMANIGWEWADGRMMGVALCMPRAPSGGGESELIHALTEIMRARGSPEDRIVEIDLPALGTWRLAHQAEPAHASLKPFRYLLAATHWATVTPIVLDRHPRESSNAANQEEVASIIATACTRIGLPAPKAIIPDRNSAIRGTAPVCGIRKAPPWTRWSLPESLKGRVITHTTLIFERPVRGPLALGAGRFSGLGLCLPLESRR